MNKIIALSLILCFVFCSCDSSILIGDKAEQTTVAVSQSETETDTTSEIPITTKNEAQEKTIATFDHIEKLTPEKQKEKIRESLNKAGIFKEYPFFENYINENNIRFTLSYQEKVVGNTFLLPLRYNISDFDVFNTFPNIKAENICDYVKQSREAKNKYYLSANVDSETFLIELTKEQSEEILAHASLNNTVVLAFTVTHVSAYTEDTPGSRLVEGTLTDVYFLAD